MERTSQLRQAPLFFLALIARTCTSSTAFSFSQFAMAATDSIGTFSRRLLVQNGANSMFDIWMETQFSIPGAGNQFNGDFIYSSNSVRSIKSLPSHSLVFSSPASIPPFYPSWLSFLLVPILFRLSTIAFSFSSPMPTPRLSRLCFCRHTRPFCLSHVRSSTDVAGCQRKIGACLQTRCQIMPDAIY